MTGEDFAFISQKVPSCFFRLGTGNKEKGILTNDGVHLNEKGNQLVAEEMMKALVR